MKRMLITMVLLGLLGGCQYVQPKMPSSIAEYDAMRKSSRGHYPDQTIVLLNRQRMVNADLKDDERVQSMLLVDRLAPEDPGLREDLASLLGQPATPPTLRSAAVDMLLAKSAPANGALLAQALPYLPEGNPQRDRIMKWLADHPSPAVASQLVELWASQRPASAAADQRFSALITSVTGKSWDVALLEGINDPAFGAPAAATELLARQLPPADLRQRLTALQAHSTPAGMLQTFARTFAYVPANRDQYQALTQIYTPRGQNLGAAAKTYAAFAADGYVFNIRDFHLLERLGLDNVRQPLSRQQLVATVTRNMAATEHVHVTAPAPASAVAESATRPAGSPIDTFEASAQKLTVADLWNIVLLQEMLMRPRVQEGLQLAANDDRADQTTAWGGLVLYVEGKADPRRYKTPAEQGRSDYRHAFNPRTIELGRDALARFQLHFEKAENSLRAGPTATDLSEAAAQNAYGLILTSISDKAFCAHYYNPQGIIVSLGTYPFMDFKNRQ